MDYLDHLENGHMDCEFVTIYCAKKTWGVVGMGSPLVLAGVASTGTVGALRLHYPPLAPQKSRTNNGGL